MAELDHLPQDGLHALRALGREQHRAVDLHDVERQLVEEREVAVAAAEIVHVDGKAHPVQRVHDVERMHAQRLAEHVERRLREFELDAFRRIDVHEFLHALEVAFLAHVLARLVDGNRQHGQALPLCLALELHDVLEIVEIELRDEAVALEQRNELAGRQKAELLALPAHERLGADAFL